MEIIGFIFGIFGLLAYLQLSTLKRRVATLEDQLAKTEGTSFFESRRELLRAARAYIGKKVVLTLKEDQQDVDIAMYGNSKHGSNTILDVDEDWMLVHIEGPKGNKDKLIRMDSVRSISVCQE